MYTLKYNLAWGHINNKDNNNNKDYMKLPI